MTKLGKKKANIVKKTELNAVQSPLPFVVTALLDNLSIQKKSAELHSKLNFPVASAFPHSYKSNPKIKVDISTKSRIYLLRTLFAR